MLNSILLNKPKQNFREDNDFNVSNCNSGALLLATVLILKVTKVSIKLTTWIIWLLTKLAELAKELVSAAVTYSSLRFLVFKIAAIAGKRYKERTKNKNVNAKKTQNNCEKKEKISNCGI